LRLNEDETGRIVRAYHDAYCQAEVPVDTALLHDRFSFSRPMMAFDMPQQHAAALQRSAAA
jgi:hypothetical protein